MAQLYELVNPQLLKVGIGTLVVAYAAKLLINYRNAIASINNLPGRRAFLSHHAIISRFFPSWRYFNGLEFFEYWNKYERMSAIHGRLVVFANHCTNVKDLKRRVLTSFLWLLCGPTTPRPFSLQTLTQ